MGRIAGKIIAFLTIAYISVACSSVYTIPVQIQVPAPITLPLEVTNLAIVNNSVPQPNSLGFYRILNGLEVFGYYPEKDSLSWDLIHALAESIDDAQFFHQVYTYKDRIRVDDDYLMRGSLSKEFRDELFETTDIQSILSVDQVLFYLEEKVINTGSQLNNERTTFFIDATLNGKVVFSVFVRDRERALTSHVVQDSLVCRSSIFGDSAEVLKTFPELLLRELSYKLGEQLSSFVVPTWQTVGRTIFVGPDSRMAEANSFAKASDWSRAEDLWLVVFDRKTKPLDKARVAMNLAVASEMQDKLKEAKSWAHKAVEQYALTAKAELSDEAQHAQQYAADLEKRVRDNLILDFQWGLE